MFLSRMQTIALSWSWGVLLLVGVFGFGCQKTSDEATSCEIHIDCEAGEFCLFSKCTPACQKHSDCPQGLFCLSNGECDQQLVDGGVCNEGDREECYVDCHTGLKECVNGQWIPCDALPVLDEEICGDGINNDCKGGIDDGCDPCDLIPDDAVEICDDGIDNDCDGDVDNGCEELCEPGEERECSGPCGPAVMLCLEEGRWGPCEGGDECLCEPDTQELKPCGLCGMGSFECTKDGVWILAGECGDQGVCSPEETAEESCGKCGVTVRICDESCQWGEPGACANEVGICAPGDREPQDCGLCGIEEKECSESCSWGEWGECTGEGQCEPSSEEYLDCGKCGQRLSVCTEECAWGEPGDCLNQGVCLSGDTETEVCDPAYEKTKTCNDSCEWGDFGECMPIIECGPGEFICPGEAACCAYSDGGCEVAGGPFCPGCLCAECVCQKDPYCCETQWDDICTDECSTECGGCGVFNDGCRETFLSGILPQYSGCEDGAIQQVTGHCYKEFSSLKEWDEAQDACQEWGGYLATLSFADEAAFVRDIASCANVWIGLGDNNTEEEFVWVDGASIDAPLAYTNWDKGEPNDKHGEDCVHMYLDGTWNDKDCNFHFCFVCEKNLQAASGCGGCSCESCVCVLDSFCCSSAWDSGCVAKCTDNCGGCGFRGCEPEETSGCGGCPCQECVCSKDNYCCQVTWDSICADACIQDCGGCDSLPTP